MVRYLIFVFGATIIILISVFISVGLYQLTKSLNTSSPIPQAVSQTKEPFPKETDLTAENASKLAPTLRLRLSQLSPEANPQVNILLRTTSALTAEQRSQLEANGANVRTVAGDIVTASLPLRQTLALAELDFVRYVELSGPLYPESP
ncbi:hypothetical protein [Leptolyngbya sp. 7M]|uniref:hypothetical protein n=1 Tax=Leptolyngbya sp. 7M TaxID=2812896 RepID=UPI001B8D3F32|nr:hypothetical protein [Leptolyngbya sp. 7M]QYO62921.1 hypothetical protein JVX88_23310 [Leptolyngbya sp. 7M]